MNQVTTEPEVPGTVDAGPAHQVLPGRRTTRGPRGMSVNRTLPNRDRRMIGAGG